MRVSQRGRGGFSTSGRLAAAILMGVLAVAGYYGARSYAPITERTETRASRITPRQEIALGLLAAPSLAERFGGLSPDIQAQQRVDRVCEKLIGKTSVKDTPYDYDCHLLADEGRAEAFALPGGQVFLTTGLLRQLPDDAQLAAVLGREIGHVVAGHGVEQLEKVRISEDRTGADVLAAYDPDRPESRRDPAVEALVSQMAALRFSAEDEQEADRLAAQYLAEAGYDPRVAAEMAGVRR